MVISVKKSELSKSLLPGLIRPFLYNTGHLLLGEYKQNRSASVLQMCSYMLMHKQLFKIIIWLCYWQKYIFASHFLTLITFIQYGVLSQGEQLLLYSEWRHTWGA